MRFNILMTLLIGGALLPVAGCGRDSHPQEQTRIAVTVLKVSESEETNSGAYTASFQPYRQTALSFQVGGYVDFIKQVPGADGRMRDLQGGDSVKEHELLATVKSDTYQAQVSQSESALAGAKAVYEEAKRDFERDGQLLSQHIIARETYDLSSEQYQSAQSQVAQAEAALKQAQINLGYCKLTAPMDGVLLSRGIEVGSLTEPASVAFQIADTSAMKAVFGSSDIQVGQFKQGQAQTLTTEAIPGAQLVGTITRIAPNADPTTRVYDVEITVPNKDWRIRPGMIASLKIAGANSITSTEATLPINAIVRPPDDQKDFAVYVVEERAGKTLARLRKVRLGDIVGNEIAVSAGVQMGDQVIVRGATMVSDGTEVQVIR